MEAGGTDCSEQENTACWDGECRPIVCAGIAEGEYMCKEAVSQHCLNNGTALQIRECSGWQYCDESTGRCRARCTPGDTRCMMGARALCNSDGYYEVDAACDADELCVSGECTPIICERNEYYCDGQAVYRCGSDGTRLHPGRADLQRHAGLGVRSGRIWAAGRRCRMRERGNLWRRSLRRLDGGL